MGLQLEEAISLNARAFAEVRLVAGAYSSIGMACPATKVEKPLPISFLDMAVVLVLFGPVVLVASAVAVPFRRQQYYKSWCC